MNLHCRNCGRYRPVTWLYGRPLCETCTERSQLEERMQLRTARAYKNTSVPCKAPKLYDALDVATYRPEGTADEIRERMEQER